MRIRPTTLPEILLLEPAVHYDARGTFMELWRDTSYADAGVTGPFVQDNLTRSSRNTLRGLHFQQPHSQGKLIQVLDGAILDVAVDIRQGSPSFGQWVALELTGESGQQLWVPPGFAHGFCVTSESALVFYKCTDYYSREHEHVVAWNDPALAIPWPTRAPNVSPRDAQAPPLEATRSLPVWSAPSKGP